MTSSNIELLNIDCMEYMAGLEDNAFDICITSPPYNMNLRINQKGSGYCSRQVVKELSTKYKNYADNLPMRDYQIFLSEFIKEACRCSGLLFLNIQQITGNKPALFSAIGDNANLLKETIIWDKCIYQPSIAEKTLNSGFEFIFVFGGNPIARQFKYCNFNKGEEANIWKIQPRKVQSELHGAGFPLELPKKILRLFAKKGQRIFDPFLGTGTTAIASQHGGFDFVGCEIDKDYYEAAVKRFNAETAQVSMEFA